MAPSLLFPLEITCQMTLAWASDLSRLGRGQPSREAGQYLSLEANSGLTSSELASDLLSFTRFFYFLHSLGYCWP